VPLTTATVRALTDELRARIDNKLHVGLDLLGEGAWDLFAMVFCESHCVGHQCWSAHDVNHPAHDPELAAAVGDPIATVYEALDAALGQLLERAGPEAYVLVLASHGMAPEYNESAVLDDVLRRLEGVSAPSPGALHRTVQARSRQLPAALRQLPLVHATRTRVHQWLETRMLERDRMRRAYFQVPHNHNAGAIRINVAGRERYGSVRPGADYRAVRERLRDQLCRLVDSTNQPVVERVLFTAEEFDGPFVDDLPDVFVEWSRREPVTAIGSPSLGWFQLPGFVQRTGDHSPAGLLFARAPGLPSLRLAHAVPVTALAPTITRLLGVSHSGDTAPIAELTALPASLCGT
jgi:predicted AlkP superfamily phosphohydrolase/phosphomutase